MTRSSPELDEQQLAELVDVFYDRIQLHPTLGPVFNAAVDDWDEHKRLLTTFWCSVALGARSYRGNPMAAHRGHPIDAAHFEEWLALWQRTTTERLAPEQAAQLQEYANRIGRSLRYGLGIDPAARGLGIPVIGAP